MSRSIWRDDEGGNAAHAPASSGAQQRRSLWREDEGALRSLRPRRENSTALWQELDKGPATPRIARPTPPPRPPDAHEQVHLAPRADKRRRERRSTRRERRHARANRRSYVAWTAAITMLLFVGDAVYVSWRLRGSLTVSATTIEQGVKALDRGAVTQAESRFMAGAQAGDEAGAVTNHPSLAIASLVPVAGTDARAIVGLGRASPLVARAGLAASSAARALGVTATGFAESFYDDGTVNLQSLARASGDAQDVERLLQAAANVLNGLREPHLEVLRSALTSTRTRVNDALGRARKGHALAAALPALLGQETKRRYLLVFEALSEARATGGLVGLYGVLSAANGRLRLEHIGPTSQLREVAEAAVDAPEWFTAAYSDFPLQQWQQVNVSPSFPTVAQVMLNMYEAVTGDRLDGVLSMNPVALQELLPADASLTSDHFATPVTKTNVADVLMRDSYLVLDERTQNDFLQDIVDQFWNLVTDGALPPTQLAEGIGRAIAQQHVKVYVRDRHLRAELNDLELDGSFRRYGAVQMIFNTNYSVNKVDYFLERDITTRIVLNDRGDASVTTKVKLTNTAPSEPASVLLGPGIEGDPIAVNRMTLSVLVPPGAQVRRLSIDGTPASRAQTYDENGYPVVWGIAEIPSGHVTRVVARYDVPQLAALSEAGGRLQFTLFPQAAPQPAEFDLTIVAPDGFAIGTGEAGRRLFSSAGLLDEPASVDLRLVAAR